MILLDLDNCISDDMWRRKYIFKSEPDPYWKYHEYHSRSGSDLLVCEQSLIDRKDIIIVTARPESYRKITENWLRMHSIKPVRIMMRGDYDHRHAGEVKYSIAAELLKEFRIEKGYDDNLAVLDAYKRLGIDPVFKFINGELI